MGSKLKLPRSVVAISLALLYSLSSLAALVTTPTASMSCCRTKAKSCCCHHQHTSDGGPELVARTCATHCGQPIPAAKAIYAANQTFAIAETITQAVPVADQSIQSSQEVPTTYQRPPPQRS